MLVITWPYTRTDSRGRGKKLSRVGNPRQNFKLFWGQLARVKNQDWCFLSFQPCYHLLKWQSDFFDKQCQKTVARTLQWVLDCDWLLVIIEWLFDLLFPLAYLSGLKYTLARKMRHHAWQSYNNIVVLARALTSISMPLKVRILTWWFFKFI